MRLRVITGSSAKMRPLDAFRFNLLWKVQISLLCWFSGSISECQSNCSKSHAFISGAAKLLWTAAMYYAGHWFAIIARFILSSRLLTSSCTSSRFAVNWLCTWSWISTGFYSIIVVATKLFSSPASPPSKRNRSGCAGVCCPSNTIIPLDTTHPPSTTFNVSYFFDLIPLAHPVL